MIRKENNQLRKFGLKEDEDRFGRRTFRPQGKAAHVAPVIVSEYYCENVDQETGESTFIRMYECEPVPGEITARHFIAQAYDEKFLPRHGKKLLPRRLNGDKANYKVKK